MPHNKLYSAGLVTAQIALIILICTRALPADPRALWIPALALILPGVVLALSAAITLRVSNFSVMPEPVTNGTLVQSGPYRFIRHPMYTSVLLVCAGLLFLNINWPSLVFFGLLIITLLLKIQREEELLRAAYRNYPEYTQSTGALLPYVGKKQ